MSSAGQGYFGWKGVSDGSSRYNLTSFLVKQVLGLIQTATLVQVKAVNSGQGVNPVGTVDVLPLVNMQDGVGNTTKHGIVPLIPYFRVQGGANAVICDPVVGDIGICVFASRDISTVKTNKAQSNPGSRRRFDWADGLYIGGVLNAKPVQYFYFTDNGITITDKNGNTIVMDDNGITITDNVNGNTIVMDSDGIKLNGILWDTHFHTGVQTGSGDTGGPSS